MTAFTMPGRQVGRTEVNATPGVNLRPLSITVPSSQRASTSEERGKM